MLAETSVGSHSNKLAHVPGLDPLIISMGTLQTSDFTTGTFAVISILVGNICLQLAPESKFQIFNNVTNETYVDTAAMEAERLHVSATLACLTAVIQVSLVVPTNDLTGEGGRPT